MAAASAPRSFADTIFARLIALAIAVLIAIIFYAYWVDDMRALFAADKQEIPILAEQPQVNEANTGLQNCLAERVGDVDKMKAEGVINDAQYANFRRHAEELCRAQHPN